MNVQDILSPAGPHAQAILELWNVTLALCLAVFVGVLAIFGCALWRGRRGGATDRFAPAAVSIAVAASAVGLIFLTVASAVTDRTLAKMEDEENPLTIHVIAHQWWWEARYQGESPHLNFTTANELHIPVGRPVALKLTADDVIHSFWVPNLGGKKDLIPGREAWLTLKAQKPGVYRGQCAEYCGAQHAKMALHVVADAPEQYEAWAAQQRNPSAEAQGELEQKGKTVFETGTCAMCHTIQGTKANGRRAPDLTHLAGRAMIAAGSAPNTRGHLAGWIVDPHSLKPGVNMPANPLTPDDLQALVAYLSSLK